MFVDKEKMIPLPSDYSALRLQNPEQLRLSMKHFYDDSWDVTNTFQHPILLYLHGSGTTTHSTLTTPWLEAALNKGFQVVTVLNFGAGTSSPSLFSHGYGAVPSPLMLARILKEYHYVDAVLTMIAALVEFVPANNSITILGQSLGADGAFAWAAMAPRNDSTNYNKVRAVLGNGATMGGYGNFKWVNIHRAINSVADVLKLVTKPAIAFYSDNDDYAPASFSRRVQRAMSDDQTNLYFISAGQVGHSWFNTRPDFVIDLAWDMHNVNPIIVNGSPAIAGKFNE